MVKDKTVCCIVLHEMRAERAGDAREAVIEGVAMWSYRAMHTGADSLYDI